MLRKCLNELRPHKAYKKLVDLVDPFVPDIVAGAADGVTAPKLLCHGDPWAHNVMLRRENGTGKVNGVAFVDFGNVRMTHPLEDFFCFLGTMAVKDAWQYPLHFDSDEKSPTRDQYESRLKKQVPAEAMGGTTGSGFQLFSYPNQMRGRAAMLVYFFDHNVWWKRSSAGSPEPSLRQFAAFAGVARLAENMNFKQSTLEDTGMQLSTEGARMRTQPNHETKPR